MGKYLSWVMIMKKMISICFLIVFLTAGALWIDQNITGQPENENIILSNNTENSEEMTESMSILPGAKYYIASENGKIVIYHSDKETIYYETSISTSQLPDEIKEKIKNGFFIETDMELYEFLENYSS